MILSYDFKKDLKDTALTNAVLGGYDELFDITEIYRDDFSAGSRTTSERGLPARLGGEVAGIGYSPQLIPIGLDGR